MGKEGYWGGRSFKRAGEAEAPSGSGCMCAFFHFFSFHPFHHLSIHHHQQQQASFNSASSVSQHYCDPTTNVPKGTEAPRNSLESEDGTMGSISKDENLKIPKNILFIKTSTGSSRGKLGNVNDLSPGTKTPTLVARLMGLDLLPDAQSPSSSSPSSSSTFTTTTTTTSSSLSASKSQVNPHLHRLRPQQHNIIAKHRHSMDDSIGASRYLPETPRISSARRSDVEHRLSLQINKENMGIEEDLELPRFSFSKMKFEDKHSSSRSPSHYAKQIVKQMKESVMSRKVGIDVTNTVRNREQARGGGEFVGQFRSKKSPRTPTSSVSEVIDELSSPGKVSNNNPSCSPRLRFMDPKAITATTKDQSSPKPVNFDHLNQPHLSRVLTKAKSQALVQEQRGFDQKQKSSVSKCKKAANERFSPLLKKPLQTSDIIRNKQDESFVRPFSSSNRASDIIKTSKSKRSHPLSANLLNLNTVQNINSNTLPVKTDPSPPATKIPQKQSQICSAREPKCSSQLSSGSRQTYTKEATSCTLSTRESNVDDEDKHKISGSMCDGPEFEYVSSILNRTGLVKGTTTTTVSVSFLQWFSPTHPLDPSIFHNLEQQLLQYPTPTPFTGSFKDRNLKTNNNLNLRCNRRLMFDLVNETLPEILGPYDEARGSGLVETLCKRIGRFQGMKCEVQEDIDALIEMEDMGKMIMKMESAEAMAAEIEGNIMDTLLHETVMVTEC